MHQDTLSWTFKLENVKTGSQPNEVFTERISDTWQFCLQEIFLQAVCFPGWHNRPILSVRASEMAVLLCGIYHTYTYYSSYTHTHKYILMQFTESLYIYLHSSLLCLLSLFSCGKLKGSINKSDYKIAQTFNPSSSFHLHATNLFLFCFFALLLGHSILHQ